MRESHGFELHLSISFDLETICNENVHTIRYDDIDIFSIWVSETLYSVCVYLAFWHALVCCHPNAHQGSACIVCTLLLVKIATMTQCFFFG